MTKKANLQKNKIFMKVAETISEFSKCVSFQVGCIYVKDGRIISMGYNGTPTGYINCCDKFDKDNFDREVHHEWSKKHEIHAEINGILYAAKNGVCIDGCDIFCTLMPCNDCLKALTQSGVQTIYYRNTYDKIEFDKDVKLMVKQSKLELIQI